MLKDTNFFLLIEDYGYSKSRTKIGVSVDITASKKTKSSRAENTVKKQKALEPKTEFSALRTVQIGISRRIEKRPTISKMRFFKLYFLKYDRLK